MTNLPPDAIARDEPRAAPRLALAAIMVAQLVAAGWWMSANGFFDRPPTSDAAWYRIDGLHMLEGWQRGGVTGWLRAGLEYQGDHPPVLPMLCGLLSVVDGEPTPRVCWLTAALFGLVLAAGTYRLARNFGTRWQAVAVTLLTVCCPVIIVQQRPMYPQMPMVAVLMWAFDALLRSQCFANRGWSIMFGLLTGLGTMTKTLTPFYLAGSMGLAIIIALRVREQRRAATINILLAVAVGAVVIAPWYVPHLKHVLAYTGDVVGAEGQAYFSEGRAIWSWERWFYYPLHFINNGVCVPLAILMIWAWIRTATRRTGWSRNGWILAAAPLLGYPALTISQASSAAFYLMPFIPLDALVLVRAVMTLKGRTRRTMIVLVVLATAWAAGLAYRGFEKDWVLKDVTVGGVVIPTKIGEIELLPRLDFHVSMHTNDVHATGGSTAEVWPNAEFFQLILAHARRHEPAIGYVADDVFRHPFAGMGQLTYEAQKAGRWLAWTKPKSLFEGTPADALRRIAAQEFILVDHRIMTYENGLILLAAGHVPHEVLASHQVTELSRVSLIAIRQPWDRGLFPPATALDAPGVVRHNVTFDNGWKLVATEIVNDAPRPVVITYWDATSAGEPQWEVHVERFDDDHAVRTDSAPLDVLRPQRGNAAVYSAITDQLGDAGPATARRFAVKLHQVEPLRAPNARSGDRRSAWASILTSDLPRDDAFTVRLVP